MSNRLGHRGNKQYFSFDESTGNRVTYSLPGSKVRQILKEPRALIDAMMENLNAEDIWSKSDYSKEKLVAFLTSYNDIVNGLSKREPRDPAHPKRPMKFLNPTNDECNTLDLHVDIFRRLFLEMFPRKDMTPYLHHLFAGHLMAMVREHGSLKAIEGQAWEAYMSRCKTVIYFQSTRGGAGGSYVTPLAKYMFSRLLLFLNNGFGGPPKPGDYFYDIIMNEFTALNQAVGMKRHAKYLARKNVHASIPVQENSNSNSRAPRVTDEEIIFGIVDDLVCTVEDEQEDASMMLDSAEDVEAAETLATFGISGVE